MAKPLRPSILPRACLALPATAIFVVIGLFLLMFAGVCDAATDAIATAGDVLQLMLPATAVGLTFGYQDWPGTLEFGESAAVTTGLTYTLKSTVHEARPDGTPQSFPSGHTSISFCSAEFIRKRYGWEYGLPAYAAATFVGYSRVEAHRHHPHDVVAGAVIGIISSYVFTRPYKGWRAEIEGDGKYCGLKLSHDW